MSPTKVRKIRAAVFAVLSSLFSAAIGWVIAPASLWVFVPVLALSVALLMVVAISN
jgi:hypothetical protein